MNCCWLSRCSLFNWPSASLSAALPALLCPALLLLALPASAGCSRPIVVPAAPTGQTVTYVDAKIGGMIPEMLTQVGARAGCTFAWSIVPRIRLETMFEAGQADLLVAATQVERRDRHGLFIPVVEARPALISLESERAKVSSIAELLARRELRVALVRGYDYGEPYRAMIDTLTAQGRVYLEADARTVARLINAAMADVTIMPASSFIGGLQGDPRIEDMATRLRIEPLDELPWIRSGIYISKKSLTPADQRTLEQALTSSVKAGLWWQALKRYYTPAVLNNNTRQIEALK
jgi:polar amino acid transport system substrate-binding protein